MNEETRRELKPIDDATFDRLVDNEMTEEQYHDLLVRLDTDPDGWRRLALAFLEARTWREAMALPTPSVETVAAPPVETVEPTEKSRPYRRGLRSRWAHRAQTVAAMAASFLIALGIGSYWNQHGGLPLPVESNDPTAVAPADPSSPAPSDPVARVDRPTVDSLDEDLPWRLVEITGPAGPDGTRQTVYLPVVERPMIDENWVRSLPPTVPDDVRQSLWRTGHQVSERRELVPMTTDDGRRIIVPIDRVNVRYVGRESL